MVRMTRSVKQRRGRGEGAIYEKTRILPSGKTVKIWVAVVSGGHDPKTGQRIRKFLYGKTKAEVQAALLKHLAAAGGSRQNSDRVLIADFVGRFVEDVKANRSANTARSYEQTLRLHVLPHVGHLRLDQIDAQRVQQLYAALRRDKTSSSMLARVHTVLRRLLNVAKRQGFIEKSPIDSIEAPRHKRPAAQSLTMEQLQRLLAAARGDRLAALFILAATTGMRQGELFGLRWTDIDLRHRALSVTHAIEEVAGKIQLVEPKTATSRRRIELARGAIDALERRRLLAKQEGHGSAYIFPSITGTPLRKSNFLRRVYYPLRTAAKIPSTVPFHALRHTAASLLLLQGTSPKVVQELLGHADVRLTLATYSHTLPTLQRQAADALDRLLRAPAKAARKAR